MSEKKKRGVSKCKKKLLHPEECTVDFDKTGRAIGKNAGRFMSFIGVEVKKTVPYNKVVKHVNPKLYEDLWEYAKATWNITDDRGKIVTLSKAKSIMRKFRYKVRKNYVYKDESPDKDKDKTPENDTSNDPFEKYDYLDSELWCSFVAIVDSEEWKPKSKENAEQNTDPSHVGRCGFSGLEPHVESRWNQLVSSYPILDLIQDDRSKMYTVSRAPFNPVTKLYELSEHFVSEGELKGTLKKLDAGSYSTKDVVTEVIGKGHQHGGRTRLYSDVIGPTKCLFSELKTKKKKSEAVETTIGASPGICGSSHAFDSSYTEILSIQKCELLDPYDKGAPTVIGMGRVHPSPERIIHNGPMIDGFVKVQIDRVVDGCEEIRLLPESCIPGAVEFLEDAKGSFIQWPAKSIKFDATSTHQQQTIPNERNEYQIYSNALQDEDAFNQLFADKQFSQNTTEHVSFSKPDEPVRASKRTEPVVASNPLKEKTKVSKEKTKVLNLLEKARARPQSIYELAQQLAIQSDKALSIVFTSPTGMYEERIEETVEFEAVIQLCVNDWIDACFMHWFTMYLYATGGQEGLNNTAYFHPRYIEGGLVSDDVEFVIDHIRNVISFHKDKQWFMAPHIAGSFSYACSKHWILVVLQHHPIYNIWMGYLFDSNKSVKKPPDYRITHVFEKAIKTKITWDKVDCRLQPNGWECGYCVMMAMYDFVICNREHMLVNKTRMVRQSEINEFVERTLKVFISSFGHGEEHE
ncbi:putative papain-like cysteine peptidase superfamily [Helianthus debilis subsp. tardiflorus]